MDSEVDSGSHSWTIPLRTRSVQDKVRGQFVTEVRLMLGVQGGSDPMEVRRRYLNNQLSADLIPPERGILRDNAGEFDSAGSLHL